jgi:Trypsin
VEHEGATPETKGLTLNLWPALRKGQILDFEPERVGAVRGPAYVHSVYTPGGNSGGPLLNLETSVVHGVLSRGLEPTDIKDAYGIATAVEAFFDWPLGLTRGATLRSLSASRVVTLVD